MEWSKLALQITAIARPRRCTVTLAGMISGSGISGEQSSARERPFRPPSPLLSNCRASKGCPGLGQTARIINSLN